MSFIASTAVQNVTVTSSTAAVTLAQFDVTALPGVGIALAIPYVIRAKITVFMTAASTPDHSSRCWEHVVVWERTNANAGAFRVLGGPFNDDGGGGLFGAATAGSPTYDVSGNFGRVRMIPYSSNSLTWFTRMDLTVLQG